jgi:hypothetical protein
VKKPEKKPPAPKPAPLKNAWALAATLREFNRITRRA